MIIIGIWNDALVFIVGAGTAGPSSSIIGCWGVYVGVGVWSISNVCSYSSASGEVSACMGCRRGEHRIGHRFSAYLIFIFLHGREYHVSDAVCWGGVHPLKWNGNPLKCAVHPHKYFLSGFGVGPV